MQRTALSLALRASLLFALGGCHLLQPPPGLAKAPGSSGAEATADALAITPEIRAAVDAPDRTDADKALDAGRKPAELLALLGIRPGMKVAELVAGGGYTTELLARVVGDSGVVYAENPRLILQKFAEKPWKERLAKPVMKNVVRADRELEYPLPPEAKDLDAVAMVLFYHDTVWMETDRERMNRSVYEKLAPGGLFAIVDHSASAGEGTKVAKSLHRIEESVVKAEVERAGFRLLRSGDFLRNPDDKRDWNASPTQAGAKRGTSDRFVLVFEKPRAS